MTSQSKTRAIFTRKVPTVTAKTITVLSSRTTHTSKKLEKA